MKTLIKLQNIFCIDESDGAGAAEPYLWVAYFKIDGENFTAKTHPDNPNKLQIKGKIKVTSPPGKHENLGIKGVYENTNISIPAKIGEFKTDLKPLYGKEMIFCLVTLMEQDSTPTKAIVEGHKTFVSALEDEINSLIPKLQFDWPGGGASKPAKSIVSEKEKKDIVERIEDKVLATIKKNLSVVQLLYNQDDTVGNHIFQFTGDEIEKAKEKGISFKHLWQSTEETGDVGEWEISGIVKDITIRRKCFVVTATTGDREHPYVLQLCHFRDQYLNQSRLGRLMIGIYYQVGPLLARIIDQSSVLRKLSLYFVVKPAVTLAHKVMSMRK